MARQNLHRDDARILGLRTWHEPVACLICGTHDRYVSNTACVACAIERGKRRYAALDEAGRAKWKEDEHARYQERKARDSLGI